jgi:hypothetical protein
MTENATRAALAIIAVVALVAAGALAFFFGDKLNGTQITLLTMIVTMIGNKAADAYGYFFDGAATKTAPLTTGIKAAPISPPA